MAEQRRRRPGFGRVLMLAFSFSVVMAVGAAAAQAEGPFWYTGSTPESVSKLSGTKTVSASIAGPTTFEIGKNAGKTLTGIAVSPTPISSNYYYGIGVFATGVEFKKTNIENTTGASGLGTMRGKIVLTGVTSNVPECVIANSKVESTELIQRPQTISGKQYLVMEPVSGPGTAFFNISIQGCLWEGPYPIKGKVAAEAGSFFETATSHTLKTSKAIETATSTGLNYGGYPFYLEGSISESLSEPLYWTLK